MEIEFVFFPQGNGEAAGNSAVVREEIEGAAVDMVGVDDFHEMAHHELPDEFPLGNKLGVHAMEDVPETVAPLLNFEPFHGREKVRQELMFDVKLQLPHGQFLREDDGEQQFTGEKPVLIFIIVCWHHRQRRLRGSFHIDLIFDGAMSVEEISTHYFEQQA